jgi:hypothetical protein
MNMINLKEQCNAYSFSYPDPTHYPKIVGKIVGKPQRKVSQSLRFWEKDEKALGTRMNVYYDEYKSAITCISVRLHLAF